MFSMGKGQNQELALFPEIMHCNPHNEDIYWKPGRGCTPNSWPYQQAAED